jgi:hypothetical protein
LKYAANIRMAADWLMEKSQPARGGLIFSEHASETDRYMYGHGLATQFLVWAYRNETDKLRVEKLNAVVTRAVKYIANAKSTQGGWYRTSKLEGHDLDEISATAGCKSLTTWMRVDGAWRQVSNLPVSSVHRQVGNLPPRHNIQCISFPPANELKETSWQFLEKPEEQRVTFHG